MDRVMIWHACSIPLFQDDQTRVMRVHYPLQVFIIDWLLKFVNQTQVGADLMCHICAILHTNFLVYKESCMCTFLHFLFSCKMTKKYIYDYITLTQQFQNFVKLCASIQILTAHEGNGEKLLSRGETQPWPS